MKNKHQNRLCDIGMIGLGVMGRNLLLNMRDHGFTVAGFDTDKNKVDSLQHESSGNNVYGATNINDFIDLLKIPRAIMLLVPAGQAVDNVINELVPQLQQKDLIVDAGNSHFTDTDRRLKYLNEKNISFLGIGISGGERGARRGPSIMPGGSRESYKRIQGILEAVAAKVDDQPCVTYLGVGSVGHYVKMVHNGIEYGIMQLIAETYDVMKRGLLLNQAELSAVYAEWNNTHIESYLLEITSHIFRQKDDKTNKPLIDEILAVAKQNGTGMWTSLSSMELQSPTPTIDIAVTMRDLSVFIDERDAVSQLYHQPINKIKMDKSVFLHQLQHAFYAAMMMVYAQGLSLLSVASSRYSYELNVEDVASIWRGGCIIRAKCLEDIGMAYRNNSTLKNILLDENVSQKIMQHQQALRQVIGEVMNTGIPIPAFMSALGYFDAMKSKWLPANLIQAQRDYFGSHTYERVDEKGVFHTEWQNGG